MRNIKPKIFIATLAALLSFVSSVSFAADPSSTQPGATQGAAMFDDSTITSKVRAAINSDQRASALKINVSTNQGTVVLKGTVPSVDLSAYLLQLVASVEGVRDVRNELKIKGSS